MRSSETARSTHKGRRRFAPLVWLSGALAAVLLVLGITGTLSGWTEAIITNDHDDVASARAVALSESSGGTTCVDTATSADNTATCSTVNKYGGVAGGGPETTSSGVVALSPGDSRTATVTLANTGTGTGNLVLGAAACTTGVNDVAGGDTTADYDVCTRITVSVECTGDATLAATAPVTLSAFTGDPVGDLAAGESTDCTFTVELPTGTPSGYSNQLAAQVLTWTLTAV